MYKIKIHTNWCTDSVIIEHFNRCCPNNDYIWKNIKLTLNNDYDFLVVFNHAIGYRHDPRKTICFFSEPVSTRNHFKSNGWNPSSDYFFVYDTNRFHNLDKWYVNLNYKQLLESPIKTKVMSGIISSLRGMEGHEDRFMFLNILDNLPYYDHFGRGNLSHLKSYKGELKNKEDGLLSYMYTFNCENTYENGYFTEKIIDPILCETLCFYNGCPNILNWFHKDSFIGINVKDKETSLDVIQKSIESDEWNKRIDFIREQKYKFLHEMNPLNVIWKIINNKL